MNSMPRTVLVLGAGFTHAFAPKAPLLIGDFGGNALARKFRKFPRASRVLNAEMGGRTGSKVDIERLMTRLDGRMPYDRKHEAESELAHLLAELKKSFVKRIRDAGGGTAHSDDLSKLAECCVDYGINCVTFNYDDIFDQALWRMRGGPYWHPDGGYGFFCRASYMVVENAPLRMDKTSMLLLKLHGSVNWRTKLGTPQPYGLDDILHHESWMDFSPLPKALLPLIDQHLSPEPFMVPPVLVKSGLVEEPVLQIVWSLAYEALAKAERVIFIGYSFPVTDMAARFLFTETLLRDTDPPDIRVVNLKTTEAERETVRRSYREVFPMIAESRFDFRGARVWSQEFVAGYAASKPESG